MRSRAITILMLTMFLSASGLAQKASRLSKPGATQVVQLLQNATPMWKPIYHRPITPFEASASLWGNIRIDGDWGYYSFKPENTAGKIAFTSLGKQTKRIARNGVQVSDGKLFAVDFQRYGVGNGELTLYTYDLTTWQGSGVAYNDFSLAALETAQAKDGTVYGEFYNNVASNQQYELGTVDYRTRTRTTFGTTTKRYVAMGITSANKLYGIAADGNLYTISTTDGTETLVGPTGIELTDEWGGPYDQTGEVDQKDDIFYWYAQDKDYNTALYTVNLTTGAATKIADSNVTMFGMVIAPATSAGDAPAAVSELTAAFAGTSKSGSISFKMPLQTAGGANLQGNINYEIKANGVQLASGTAQPGEQVTAPVSVSRNGEYTFVVTASNASGASPEATMTKWIGFDEPEAVGNPTATLIGSTVTVSWTAPTAGAHQGTLGNLTYDVVRIEGHDSTRVATGISQTTCTDDVSAAHLASYTYSIRAISDDVKGRWANTGSLIAGAAIEPDWNNVFKGANALALFKVIDANNDRFTWWCNGTPGYGVMSNQAHARSASDDWVVTPPIHLTTERVYNISFKVRNMNNQHKNTLEVRWGTGNTPEQMSNVLVKTFEPEYAESNEPWQVCSADLIANADGHFYIGFHDNTSAESKYQIAIDSITITKTAYTAAPDSVKSLTATAEPAGVLKAKIEFVAPSVTLNGAILNRVDSFSVVRDGKRTARISGTTPGSRVEWMDNEVQGNGFHTYTITPYLDGHEGRAATVRTFVGMDKPKNTTGISFTDQSTNLLARWDAFGGIGVNGGFLYPENVSVSFFSLINGDFGYELGDSLTTSTKGATSAVLHVDPNITTIDDGKTQTLAWFAVRANGDGGQSEYVTARGVVIGPSITLPFKESMKGGRLDNGFASLLGNAQYNSRRTAASWRVVTDAASDNDGGSLVWSNYTQEYAGSDVEYKILSGDETSVNMPKVTLSGAVNPKLFFDLYSLTGNEVRLKVMVQTPDGTDHVAAEYDMTKTAKNGWDRQQIDLSQYKAERYVILKFGGIAEGSKVMVGVDNVNIIDQLERNIAATGMKTPESIVAGKEDSVEVAVQNLGARAAAGYGVELYVNDKLTTTVSVNRELAPLANDTVRLKLPVAINEKEPKLNVRAEVVYDNDLLPDDNETETKQVEVIQSPYGRVNNLRAEAEDGGKVSLTWGWPVLPEPERVVDGFENYSPFATQMAPWTLVDADKGAAGVLQPSSSYPHQGEAFAFTAFNPNWWIEDMTNVNPGLKPYDGSQYAAAIYAYDANRKLVAQDNWMISPRLSGRSQQVTFYVMNIAARAGDNTYAESFDVLYSTEDADTTHFIKLESQKADGTTAYSDGANWKQITVNLPEGAKYFAIHHNTGKGGSYVFGVDDVSYEQLAIGADDEVTAFLVYKDGKLIARLGSDKMSYVDNDGVGSHVYNITAVYRSKDGDVNESGFSNDASTVVTSIGAVHDDDRKIDVVTVGGARVRTKAKTLDGLRRGVYIINGKKKVVR